MELRDYQQNALVEVRRKLKEGSKSILLVAPTGAGKGTIAAHVLKNTVARGGRALFLVHRGEILADVGQRLMRAGITDIGFLKAGSSRGGESAPVQLASVQTLASRADERPEASVVVWDEAHHAVASTYRAIRAAYPDAVHLGLTATPQRADRSPLGDCFDSLVVAATPAELRDRGFLVPCDTYASDGGNRALAMSPLAAWQRYSEGRRAVVFCASVPEAEAAARAFCAAGVPAASVDGTTPAADRKRVLEQLARGELLVVTNVFVLTEGFDLPALETCILARGCGAESTFLQMIGRVLRASPGKERATFVDLRGVVHEHGLPYDTREYTLDGSGIKRAAEKKLVTWSCESCYLVNPRSAKACERCQAPKPERIVQQEVKASAVQEVTEASHVDGAFKRRVFNELCTLRATRGFKPGFVGVRFKEQFGHWPKWPVPQTIAEVEAAE